MRGLGVSIQPQGEDHLLRGIMYTDGFFEKYRTDNFANKVTNIIGIVAAFVRAIAKVLSSHWPNFVLACSPPPLMVASASAKLLIKESVVRELVMVGVWYKKHRGHPFDTSTISAINKSGSGSSHLLQ